MRILIAEDEKDLNTLLKKRLENQKYSVDACFDGEEAIDYDHNNLANKQFSFLAALI